MECNGGNLNFLLFFCVFPPFFQHEKSKKGDHKFFFGEWQGFPQDLGFWPPRGTSQKKVEFFFFFQ